jgi:hypothetical protein
VLGACWIGSFGNSLLVFIQLLGKIISRGKVHGRRRKAREHATKVHPRGQCAEGGKCVEGRKHIDMRINQTEE